MFEFKVGENEVHKIKVTRSTFFSPFKVFIDDKFYKQFYFVQSVYPFAFEVGIEEKHFVFLQFAFINSSFNYNIEVFIDNKFKGTFNFK